MNWLVKYSTPDLAAEVSTVNRKLHKASTPDIRKLIKLKEIASPPKKKVEVEIRRMEKEEMRLEVFHMYH